jgi:hypothetical protein
MKGIRIGFNATRDEDGELAYTVWRCRSTASNPVLKAPMVSALETVIS